VAARTIANLLGGGGAPPDPAPDLPDWVTQDESGNVYRVEDVMRFSGEGWVLRMCTGGELTGSRSWTRLSDQLQQSVDQEKGDAYADGNTPGGRRGG
jgi:hypothetical protein